MEAETLFLRKKGLNHAFKLKGSDFYGTLLDLLREFSEEQELKKLPIHDVSRRSELLFAFIAEIKSEFADQNWDYLDFIAERVIGKQ